VAQGVSDVEIWEDFAAINGAELRLLDDLHAKLYVGDGECLVGSANVTLKGLGLAPLSNTELLVGVDRQNLDVNSFMDSVYTRSRIASSEEALQVSVLANNLPDSELRRSSASMMWLPTSKRPDKAYEVYCGLEKLSKHTTPVEDAVIADLARIDIPPGLSEADFKDLINRLLASLPALKELLSAETMSDQLTKTDFESTIQDLVDRELVDNAKDAWSALSMWIGEFVSGVVVRVEGEYVIERGVQL